jgi:hypothetical protein
VSRPTRSLFPRSGWHGPRPEGYVPRRLTRREKIAQRVQHPIRFRALIGHVLGLAGENMIEAVQHPGVVTSVADVRLEYERLAEPPEQASWSDAAMADALAAAGYRDRDRELARRRR